MTAPAIAPVRPGQNTQVNAAARNTPTVARVTWFGVTSVFDSGARTTAARGRATKRFQKMSRGLLVRR